MYFQNSTINLEITNFCNIECTFCGNPGVNYPRGSMALDEFKQIVEKLRQSNPDRQFEICGYGEPFVNKEIYEIVQYMAEKKIPCSIVTNGTIRIKEEQISPFFALEFIRYSVDAISNEVFNLTRPATDVNAIIENISDFIRLRNLKGNVKPEVIVRMNVFKSNHHQIDTLINKFLGLGVDKVHIVRGGASSQDQMVELFSEDFEKYDPRRIILQGAVSRNSDIVIEENPEKYNRPKMFRSDYTLFEELGCPFPTVRWDGEVCPCCHDEMATAALGNINTENPERIFSSENLTSVVRKINSPWRRFVLTKSKACDSCSLYQKSLTGSGPVALRMIDSFCKGLARFISGMVRKNENLRIGLRRLFKR